MRIKPRKSDQINAKERALILKFMKFMRDGGEVAELKRQRRETEMATKPCLRPNPPNPSEHYKGYCR